MKRSVASAWHSRWLAGVTLGWLAGCAAPAALSPADHPVAARPGAVDTVTAAPAAQRAAGRVEPLGVPLSTLLPPQVKAFTFNTIQPQEFTTILQTLGITWDSMSEVGSRHYFSFPTPELAERAVLVWKALDTPPSNIQLRFELMRARPEALLHPDKDGGLPGQLLQGQLLEQLQSLFHEYAFQVLSTSTVVAQSGNRGNPLELVLAGVPTRDPSGIPLTEQFMVSVRPTHLPEAGAVQLQELEITRVLLQHGQDPSDVDDQDFLDTTLNLRDGQTVVVGGSAIDGVTYVVAVTANLML
ncbi:MAG: hypothetical protein AB1505_12060 [Candidatus Latescibacterota bacterium]